MQRKRRGLIALWMACVLLLTMVPAPVGADGTDISVNLYKDTEVLKPGSPSGLYEMGDLSPGIALDKNQAKLVSIYGTDLKGNCPAGYTRDGWRIWKKDAFGLVAGRWVSDTDANWASYMTGYYDLNNGGVVLAPNWVPEYAAGETNGADNAVVIKKAEDGAILVNGNIVTDGSVEADGSVKADGTEFHFQWLHEYKLVGTPSVENQINGTAEDGGDYYNESTGKWMKGGGESSALGIKCELQAGDVVVVKDIGNGYSDCPYYFNGYLWNEDSFTQTYLETYDKENKVFYAVVPATGKNYALYLRNMDNYMEIEASVSVFRADSFVTGQTSAVYTGAAGTYCCQISYEKDVVDGSGQTEKKTFKLFSDIVTVEEKYEITNECGANGSCSIEIDGKEVYGSGIMAAPGQEVTVKAVPADGYEEDTVSIRRTGMATAPEVQFTTTEDENGNKIRTFTMPDYPVTVKADFIQAADTQRPVISGVEEGKTYYGPVTFQVKDASPVDVWLDGKQIQLDKDGMYTIQPDNASHTITATDKAGNTSTCTITVCETWMRDGITANGSYELRSGTAYKLGAGTWKIAEDDTVYAGGNTFYVPDTKSYEFRKQ